LINYALPVCATDLANEEKKTEDDDDDDNDDNDVVDIGRQTIINMFRYGVNTRN
jgi:hypothetical protein